jgi:hypothetical protein
MLDANTTCNGPSLGIPRTAATRGNDNRTVEAAREPPVFRTACRYTPTFIPRGGSIRLMKV